MNLILFAVIVVLAVPQFGKFLGRSDRPFPLIGSLDPDVRPFSFHSWWNRLYRPNHQNRTLCRTLDLQRCDHRMDRCFNSLRYCDYHSAHNDFGTFSSHSRSVLKHSAATIMSDDWVFFFVFRSVSIMRIKIWVRRHI